MPTKNTYLTDAHEAMIERRISAGEYQNASEVVRDAIRDWRRHRLEYEEKKSILRSMIQESVDAMKRGEYTEVSDADLDKFIDSLGND